MTLSLLAMHNLEKYPELIADAQMELLATSTQIIDTELLLSVLLFAIDSQVAFDETLKNDTQRKAKRTELSQQPDCQELRARVRTLEYIQKVKQIEIEKLINEFTYLKIKAKEEIVFFEKIASV